MSKKLGFIEFPTLNLKYLITVLSQDQGLVNKHQGPNNIKDKSRGPNTQAPNTKEEGHERIALIKCNMYTLAYMNYIVFYSMVYVG